MEPFHCLLSPPNAPQPAVKPPPSRQRDQGWTTPVFNQGGRLDLPACVVAIPVRFTMRKVFFFNLTSCLSWLIRGEGKKRRTNGLTPNFNLSSCSSTTQLFPPIPGVLMPLHRDITKLSNPPRSCVGRTRFLHRLENATPCRFCPT